MDVHILHQLDRAVTVRDGARVSRHRLPLVFYRGAEVPDDHDCPLFTTGAGGIALTIPEWVRLPDGRREPFRLPEDRAEAKAAWAEMIRQERVRVVEDYRREIAAQGEAA